jgi:hypothetical protein
MEKNYISRREFLKIFGTMAGATALASCTTGGQQPAGEGKHSILAR